MRTRFQIAETHDGNLNMPAFANTSLPGHDQHGPRAAALQVHFLRSMCSPTGSPGEHGRQRRGHTPPAQRGERDRAHRVPPSICSLCSLERRARRYGGRLDERASWRGRRTRRRGSGEGAGATELSKRIGDHRRGGGRETGKFHYRTFIEFRFTTARHPTSTTSWTP